MRTNLSILFSKFKFEFDKNPFYLIDVGSRGGLKKRWKKIREPINVIAFEPETSEFKKIRKTKNKMEYLNIALSCRKNITDFFITTRKSLSSLFYPNYDFLRNFPDIDRYRIDKIIKIRTNKLDNICKNKNIKDIDFIKIDTQGCELKILKGSIESIQKAFGIEIEVAFQIR